MTQRLSQKTALITGATSGIGKAIAFAFAAEGAHVIITGRNRERGEEVVAKITSTGGKAQFIAADFAKGKPVIDELVATVTAATGNHLDILVNNAAYLVGGMSTTETSEQLIDDAFAVSVRAPFLLTAALVPGMIVQGGGVIINMGSINGIVGMTGAALYGATKSAIHSLTKSWAAEFGPAGIRVNTIAPGPTLTEFALQIREHLQPMIDGVPSRQFSTPEQIAAAAVFLASDDAANIHGATLSVDGGFTTI